jgi:hypothetical protein
MAFLKQIIYLLGMLIKMRATVFAVVIITTSLAYRGGAFRSSKKANIATVQFIDLLPNMNIVAMVNGTRNTIQIAGITLPSGNSNAGNCEQKLFGHAHTMLYSTLATAKNISLSNVIKKDQIIIASITIDGKKLSDILSNGNVAKNIKNNTDWCEMLSNIK